MLKSLQGEAYKLTNSDKKLQVEEGIDAVIVDSVLAIRKGLQEKSKGPIAPQSTATADAAMIPSSGDERG